MARATCTRCSLATLLLTGLAALAMPETAQAHPGADERAHHMSEKLAHHPHDPQLLLRRGELHVEDGDFEAARRDFDRAEHLAPDLAVVDLYRGLMWLEAKQPKRARDALELYLAEVPGDAKAMQMRAEALSALGELEAAAQAYAGVLEVDPNAGPEPFLRRATLLEKSGNMDDALQTVEDGLGRVGPNIALVERAVDLEQRRGDPGAALGHIASLSLELRDSPRWLTRTAGLLAADDRPAEALAAYCRGLWKIGSLPPSRRKAPAIALLRTQMLHGLSRLL